ncbi:MAG: hypothetical protein AB8F78_14305 [Saprospiraceae bacterium]
MFNTASLFLAGMPWNFLTPLFLGGVGLGIVMAKRSAEKNSK